MQTVGYINTNKDNLHGQKWNTEVLFTVQPLLLSIYVTNTISYLSDSVLFIFRIINICKQLLPAGLTSFLIWQAHWRFSLSVLLTKYYTGNQINKYWEGYVARTVERRAAYTLFVGEISLKDTTWNLGIVSSPLCVWELWEVWVVEHNYHWGVILVIMYWETTTCFGPWWPPSGCLGST